MKRIPTFVIVLAVVSLLLASITPISANGVEETVMPQMRITQVSQFGGTVDSVLVASDPVSPTGQLVYAGIGDRFTIFDPDGTEISRTPLGWFVDSVAVSDTLGITTQYGRGLALLNISDPVSPTVLSRYSTQYPAFEVNQKGGYALVGTWEGLEIVNIGDPIEPILESFAVYSQTQAFTVSGNYAYLTESQTNMLHVIDISDPANPAEVGALQFDWGNIPATLDVRGSTLLVGNWSNGSDAWIVDVTNPTAPQISGTIAILQNGGVMDVALNETGTLAFIAKAADYNCCNTHNLQSWQQRRAHVTTPIAQKQDMPANYAPGAIHIVDISNPDNPLVLASFEQHDDPNTITVQDNTLYVGWSNLGLDQIDISNPGNPQRQNTIGGAGWPSTLALSQDGSTAYVGLWKTGFGVLALNGSAISQTKVLQTPHNTQPSAMLVEGNRLWIGEGNDGISWYNISDPQNPIYSGNVQTPGYVSAFELPEDQAPYLLVAESGWNTSRLSVWYTFNITPTLTYSYPVPNQGEFMSDLKIMGAWLYATADQQLMIFNVAPQYPMHIIDVPIASYRIDGVNFNTLYLSGYDAGPIITTVDVSDPHYPQITGSINLGGDGYPDEIKAIPEKNALVIALSDGTYQVRNLQDPNTLLATHQVLSSDETMFIWRNDLLSAIEGPSGFAQYTLDQLFYTLTPLILQ